MRDYNPLSVNELGRNAARALMEYPADALPPNEAFVGAGVYTLHYTGTFPSYADTGLDVPIYVGKADPPGRRQGRTQSSTTVLHRRLQEHADSTAAASNLNLTDFTCRRLVLDPVWIGLTEQMLLAQYQPLWNVVVDGFGNHDPGAGRRNQRRSRWDTLHPGREWASRLRDRGETAADVIAAIEAHRECRQTRHIRYIAPTRSDTSRAAARYTGLGFSAYSRLLPSMLTSSHPARTRHAR